MVIEESKRGPWNWFTHPTCPWYAFVSQETYHIRPSSITGYDSAYLIIIDLSNCIHSIVLSSGLHIADTILTHAWFASLTNSFRTNSRRTYNQNPKYFEIRSIIQYSDTQCYDEYNNDSLPHKIIFIHKRTWIIGDMLSQVYCPWLFFIFFVFYFVSYFIYHFMSLRGVVIEPSIIGMGRRKIRIAEEIYRKL